MTDKKISQLTGATTPVAGTEVLPIVQSGSTVKVSIADLTAGRSISTAGASLDGAVTINDSGADVDFRIESDTNTHAFFLDGATGNVGIGTNLPGGKFNIDFGNYVGVGARFQFNSSNVPVCINALNNSGDTYLSWNAAAKSSSNTATYVINGGATKIEGGGSQIIFYNAPSGTAGADITFTERLRISSSGAFVFNEPGNDVDFRVEGDTDANLLFADASADRVGLGTNAPNQKLEVAGNLRLSGAQVGSKIESRQNAISVSTATTILDDAGAYGRVVIVNGSDASVNRFCDLVFASSGENPTVISSFTAIGSPAARTYTRSGSALQLAMASGTYDVFALAIGF